MIDEGRTLEDEIIQLRDRVGLDSFIAVMNLKSTNGILQIGDRHVFNLKFIEQLGHFIRQDEVEPEAQSIGISDQDMLQQVKDISIYAWCQTDTTKRLHQINGACVSAWSVYHKIQLPPPMEFDYVDTKVPKALRRGVRKSFSVLHPRATTRATEAYERQKKRRRAKMPRRRSRCS